MVRAALLGFLAIALQAADFRVDPISTPLLAKMRQFTWRVGCPVAPEDLRQVTVKYRNFNGKTASGVLIVNRDAAKEIGEIFADLYKKKFPIERISPVEEYGGDDDKSMAANNTSAFNCRSVTGRPGVFSNHSWGLAVDVNPLTNPYVKGPNISPPEGRKYLDRSQQSPGLIHAGDFVVNRFAKSAWKWGGDWTDLKDYQHFEKSPRASAGNAVRP